MDVNRLPTVGPVRLLAVAREYVNREDRWPKSESVRGRDRPQFGGSRLRILDCREDVAYWVGARANLTMYCLVSAARSPL